MTAPALPGAALPPEVERAIVALSDANEAVGYAQGSDSSDAHLDNCLTEQDAARCRLRAAILAAIAPIAGLDDVRAAHRAEVERAVAEAVRVERSLAAAVCRYKSSFFYNTTVGRRLSASECAAECAEQINRGCYPDAIIDIAAAIRTRGAKS